MRWRRGNRSKLKRRGGRIERAGVTQKGVVVEVVGDDAVGRGGLQVGVRLEERALTHVFLGLRLGGEEGASALRHRTGTPRNESFLCVRGLAVFGDGSHRGRAFAFFVTAMNTDLVEHSGEAARTAVGSTGGTPTARLA